MSVHYNIRAHTPNCCSDVMVRGSNYLEKLYFDLRLLCRFDLINLKSTFLIGYIHLIFT